MISPALKWGLLLGVLLCSLMAHSELQAFTLNVVDSTTGAPIAGGFRWLVEGDNTVTHVPGVSVTNSIGLVIHKSHAPVIANGTSAGASTNIGVPPSARYFVSILPDSGYANGGGSVEIGQAAVTVKVNPMPIPTAQISLLCYVDQRPINNLKDEGDPGLGGCNVIVSDAGGPLSQDAFGNPLGTQYAFNPTTGQPILDAGGNPTVTQMGTGIITTITQNQFAAGGTQNPYNLPVGEALIKYLPPGKYGVIVIPPSMDDNGAAITWTQTTTIEGTPTIDAWVKANEPQLFVEGFGVGFKHVAFGFVKTSPGQQSYRGQTLDITPWNTTPPACTPACATITGTQRFNHFSKPPATQGFFTGAQVPECWVGLNNPFQAVEVPGPGGTEVFVNVGLYHAQCDEDSNFTIPNVPPGDYQLVTWDSPLDALFGINSLTVDPSGTTCNGGGSCNLGDLFILRWFGTWRGSVFFDRNENGFRECVTPGCADTTQDDYGIPNQNLNIRFRDGSIYQFQPTDPFGDYEFAEVFPFFKWLVVEVDFLRFKATGMTAVVDNGGAVLPHAQSGPATPQRIDSYPSFGELTPQPQLTPPNYPFSVPQVVPPQTAINNANTSDNNNLSRTETGPVLLQAMHLFLNQTNVIEWGKNIYAPGENGGIAGVVYYSVTRAENDPRYGVPEPWEPGIPSVQVNLYEDFNADGVPDGPVISTAFTDSWDLNPPTGCTQVLPVVNGAPIGECADAFHTWNQLRNGVFDGGYAFGPAAGQPSLTPGTYIVEVIPPIGYELVKEEDKNVDFGNSYTPSPLVIPPPCVGASHLVPQYLALFSDQLIEVAGWTPGMTRPLCDRKQAVVRDGQNTAADFHLFTSVPKAARAVGFTNNDLAAEFNVFSPNFGEKLAPAWIPVSFKDWQGNEIVRVYTDEFGGYNALLPSTYSVNVPTPSGVSPNMITLVLNDPIRADGTSDPYYNPTYTVTPWTFDYWPGKTSYLDTPLVPVTAFASGGGILDTDPPTLTPAIRAVNPTTGGPVLCSSALPAPITITSMGATSVLNPNYQPGVPGSTALYIQRDYGFGTTAGTVTLDGSPLAATWGDATITATVPGGANTGRLMVTRDNGATTEVGVTINIIDCATTTVRNVTPSLVVGATPIQDAIDLASAGDIIMVAPGFYNENVIMNKPVRLQGYGAGSTFINGNPVPVDRLQIWHQRIDAMGGAQFASFLLKNPFSENEAPVIIAMGETQFPGGTIQIPDNTVTRTFNPGNPFTLPGQAAIDGFSLQGSKGGGGIFAISHARYLTVSNNIFVNNQGGFAGGFAAGVQDSGFDFTNVGISVIGNKFHRNGGLQGAGAISMNEGSHNYLVAQNRIIGNFSRFNGAGINHRGLSNDGMIARNQILFNEDHFNALLNRAGDGGGIYVGGGALLPGTVPSFGIAAGSGSVTIDGNLIQGNLTGSGNGGGIIVQGVNGLEIVANPTDPTQWYTVRILNNMIVNNVAGRAGAGIYLNDVVSSQAFVINNTVANNDSTATSRLAFPAGSLNSTPLPAGIVSSTHSQSLIDLLNTGCPPAGVGLPCTPIPGGTPAAGETFSSPTLVNNIVRNNRSWFNDAALNAGAGGLAANPTMPVWDLGIVGVTTPQYLSPQNCVLTSLGPNPDGSDYTGSGNTSGDPLFNSAYANTLTSATILDEMGNNINVRYTPLMPNSGDYHVAAGGSASDAGQAVSTAVHPPLERDFDGQSRNVGTPDIGADEIGAAGTNFTIVATAGSGGTISPAGAILVSSGGSQAFSITADPGSSIYNVYVDGVPQGAGTTSYTFTGVNANHTITAVFRLTITATAGAGGTITPSGALPVVPDSSQTFAIAPDAGFYISDVVVDGGSVCAPNCLAQTVYTFLNVNANHTIAASFVAYGDTPGLYNPVTGTFYLRNSNTTGVADVTPFVYGPTNSTWTPLVGNWDGAGGDTIGLYNPVTGTFYLRNSNTTGVANVTPFVYGPTNSTWTPLVGNWDGAGGDTIGLYNPVTGTFYLRNSNTTGVADVTPFVYGPTNSTWKPIVGDWNGDGVDTIGLYNPATSTFYLRNSNTTGVADIVFTYGPAGAGWLPLMGNWNGLP